MSRHPPKGCPSVDVRKEWQAIMDYLSKLPVKKGSNLPVVPVDARAAETRAIKVK
jgi:hypothetical protein